MIHRRYGDSIENTAKMRTEPKGLFRLVAPIMARVIDRQFRENWDRLRAALEEP